MFQQQDPDGDLKNFFEKDNLPQEFIVAGCPLSEESSKIVKSLLIDLAIKSCPQNYTLTLTAIVEAWNEVVKSNGGDSFDNSELINKLKENNSVIQRILSDKRDLNILSIVDLDLAYRRFQKISTNFVEYMETLEVVIRNLETSNTVPMPEQFKDSFDKSIKHVERLKNMLFMPISIPGESNLSELLSPHYCISTPKQQVLTSIPMPLAVYLSSIVPEYINAINDKIVHEVMNKVSLYDFISTLNESDEDFQCTRLGSLINGLQSYKEAEGKLGTDGCLNFQYEIATPLISLWKKEAPSLVEKLEPYSVILKELGGGLYVGGDIEDGKLSIDLYYPIVKVDHQVDTIFLDDDYPLLDYLHEQYKKNLDKAKFDFALVHDSITKEKISYQIEMSLFDHYEVRREISNVLLAVKKISEKSALSNVLINAKENDLEDKNLNVSIVSSEIEDISFHSLSQAKGFLFDSKVLSDYDVQEYISKLSSLIKIVRLKMLQDSVSLKDVKDRLEKIYSIVDNLRKKSDKRLALVCDFFCDDEKLFISEEDGTPILFLDLDHNMENTKAVEKVDSMFDVYSLKSYL